MAIQYLYYRVRIDRMQLAWNVIDNVINARQRIDYGQYGTIEWNVWVCVKEKWKKKYLTEWVWSKWVDKMCTWRRLKFSANERVKFYVIEFEFQRADRTHTLTHNYNELTTWHRGVHRFMCANVQPAIIFMSTDHTSSRVERFRKRLHACVLRWDMGSKCIIYSYIAQYICLIRRVCR